MDTCTGCGSGVREKRQILGRRLGGIEQMKGANVEAEVRGYRANEGGKC